MISKTEQFNNAFKSSHMEIFLRVTINGVTYEKDKISNAEINYQIASDGGLMVGSTFSNGLRMTFTEIITTFNELDEVYAELGIRIADGSIEYCPLGVYIISEAVDVDRNDNQTTINCLDNLMLMEGTYESSLTYPASIRDVALEIANKAGMTINTTNFSRLSTNTIKKIEGATYRQAIGMIAQLEAGYALFNRQGELEIRTLNNTEFEISPDHYRSKGLVKNDLQYRLGGISVEVDDESSLRIGSTQGSQISLENSVMTQLLLDNIYTKIENINFYPFTLEWWGNPALEVGDWVLITDLEGNEFKAPVLSYKLKFDGGISSTISADVETTSNHVTTYKPPLQQKLQKLGLSIANNKGEVTYFGLDAPIEPKNGDRWYKMNGPDEEFWIYVDGEWKEILSKAVIKAIQQEILDALNKAESAKQVAEQSYTDSVAEAERLVQVQTDAFNSQMSDVNDEISTVKTNIDTAISNVNQEIANNFTSLSDSISDVNDIADQAKTDAATALSQSGTALSNASTALSNANTALSNASTALSEASSANDKAIKSTVIHWALSSSGTTPPTSGWSTTIPTPSSTQFTWGRTTITLNDGTTIPSYNVSKIGANGSQGPQGPAGSSGVDAPKITAVKQQYYLSTSNTTQSGGSWSESIPVWSTGKYYWTRVVTTYDNSTSTPSVAVLDNALNQSLVSALEAKSATQTLSTTVSQHATQIAAKANQTTVDTLAGRVSTAEGSIAIQAGDIALKASQTSVDTLTGRVSTAEGQISTQAGQIALRATTSTVNALTSRVSAAEASLVVQSGKIDLAATKSELTTAIDGIEVGGRNLLRGSSDFSPLFWSAVQYVTTSTMNSNLSMAEVTGPYPNGPHTAMNTQGWNFTIGERYTVSVYARSDDTGQKLGLTAQTSNWQPQDVTSEWRRYSWTFVAHSSTLQRFRFESATTSSIWITQPKIEKGNIATDWTPAPEDVDAAISTVQSNLTVEAGKITALTTRVSGSETNISNVTQTVSGITSTISTLRTDVDGKATIVALNSVKSTADGNKTTISNHAGRLTTVETNVSGLQTTVSNKADKSQITQLENSISSTVSTAIDGLVIGGRNLLRNSNDSSQWGGIWTLEYKEGHESIHAESLSTTRSWVNINGSNFEREYDVGTTLTLSGWFYVDSSVPMDGITNFYIRLREDSSGKFHDNFGIELRNIEKDKWVRAHATYTLDHRNTLVQLGLGLAKASVYFRDIKLEKGNKATDWTPAPEDQVSQTQLTQTVADFNARIVEKGNVVAQFNMDNGTTLISNKKLLLDANTYIMGTTFANDVKAKSLEAITANITSIRSQILVSDVVSSTHLKADTALIDKLFATTALINQLTSKTAFINSVKAIDISADRITTGTLNAANVNIINLNVSSIVGLNSNFVHSLWNSNNASVSISADGLVSIGSDGDKTKIRNGLVQFWNNSNNLTGSVGTSYNTLDGADTGVAVFLEFGKTFSVNRKSSSTASGYAQLMSFPKDYAQLDLRRDLSMHSNDIVNVGKITVQNGIEMSRTSISNAWQVTFVNSTNDVGRVGPMSNSNDLGVHSSGALYLGVNGSNNYSSPLVVRREEVQLYNRLNVNKQQISDAWDIRFRNNSAEYGGIVNPLDTNDIAVVGSGSIFLSVGSTSSFTTTMRIRKELIDVYWNINMNGKSVTGTSDARLKTNITPTNVIAIDHFRQFDFVDYNWIDTNMSHDRQFGLIAQDTPFISLYDKSNDLWLLDNSKQTMLNSLGIKELVSIADENTSDILRIDTFVGQHEQEINNLKQEIASLKQEVEYLKSA